MPRIKVSGVKLEHIQAISEGMVDELQTIIGCPRDYFALECINNIFIKDGAIFQADPFIEVAWFNRGQEIQDNVAKVITGFINTAGYNNVDVVFTVFDKNAYYENGEHF